MIEIFDPPPGALSQSIAMDVIWGNLWMACMLFLIGRRDKIDAMIGADNSSVALLQRKMQAR